VVYGPALDRLESTASSVSYTATQQSELSATIGTDSAIRIDGGAIDRLNVEVKVNGSFDANNASIKNVELSAAEDADITFGVIETISMTTPSSCPSESQSKISLQDASTITHNGQMLQKQSTTSSACTSIDVRQLEIDSNDTV
jgi:hypothetical protein